jgi:hypothetical protein
MSLFSRRGHHRTNRYGNTYWVGGHNVVRNNWSCWPTANDIQKRLELEGQGRTACYVNPNAVCPVCGIAVFYYQNEFGSRVYFDELGPPWPKHPCTDARFSILSSRSPKNKTDVERDAALLAATDVGLELIKSFARKYGQSPWHLMKVVRSFRTRDTELVAAQSIENSRRIYFRIKCKKRMLRVGDIFAKKASRISLLDQGSLNAREINIVPIKRIHEFIDALPSR